MATVAMEPYSATTRTFWFRTLSDLTTGENPPIRPWYEVPMLGGMYACPSAKPHPQRMGDWWYWPNCYVTCPNVLANEWDSSVGWKTKRQVLAEKVKSPGVQLALAENYFGAAPGWDMIYTSVGSMPGSYEGTFEEWTWGLLYGSEHGSYIHYNHGLKDRTNILIADGHVEAGVAVQDGHTWKYHDPS